MFSINNKLMVCFKEDKVQMLKIFQLCIRYLFLLAYKLWTCLSYLITKQTKTVSSVEFQKPFRNQYYLLTEVFIFSSNLSLFDTLENSIYSVYNFGDLELIICSSVQFL